MSYRVGKAASKYINGLLLAHIMLGYSMAKHNAMLVEEI